MFLRSMLTTSDAVVTLALQSSCRLLNLPRSIPRPCATLSTKYLVNERCSIPVFSFVSGKTIASFAGKPREKISRTRSVSYRAAVRYLIPRWVSSFARSGRERICCNNKITIASRGRCLDTAGKFRARVESVTAPADDYTTHLGGCFSRTKGWLEGNPASHDVYMHARQRIRRSRWILVFHVSA